MCGRFTLQIPIDVLIEIFGISELPSFTVEPRYNIAPTQQIPVVRQYADYQTHLDMMRWGLIPSWAKDGPVGPPLINARSETVTEKPAFRQAIKYRRCLIPASGFYEWRREGTQKVPHYIRLKDGSPMIFASIWESGKGPDGKLVDTCSILTTAANDLVASLHDRMPVILLPSEFDDWLNRDQRDPEKLKRFYKPFSADLMETFPVSSQVKSPESEEGGLIGKENR